MAQLHLRGLTNGRSKSWKWTVGPMGETLDVCENGRPKFFRDHVISIVVSTRTQTSRSLQYDRYFKRNGVLVKELKKILVIATWVIDVFKPTRLCQPFSTRAPTNSPGLRCIAELLRLTSQIWGSVRTCLCGWSFQWKIGRVDATTRATRTWSIQKPLRSQHQPAPLKLSTSHFRENPST